MPHSRTLRRAAAGVLLACVAGVLVRAAVLFRNTRALGRVSAAFPRRYTVGSGGAAAEGIPAQRGALAMVVLGDSTAVGTGADTLSETLPYRVASRIAAAATPPGQGVAVTNRAVSGARIADVRGGQIAGLSALRPALILINCGANDATHFTPLARYRADLAAVLDAACQCRPQAVLIADTPDLAPVPALPPIYRQAAARAADRQNRVLRALVAAAPGENHGRRTMIAVIDLYGRGKLTRSSDYAADDFHPSAQGYARWAALYPAAAAGTARPRGTAHLPRANST